MAKKPDNKEYEKIGKLIVSIGESGGVDKKRLYKTAFIKGIFSGLGGVVGATLVVSFLLWLFTVLGDVPFLSSIVDIINNNISN